MLTVSAHSYGDALLQPAVLAAVSVDAKDGTLLVLRAGSVLDFLLDAAAKEALGRTIFLNTIVTIAPRAAVFYTSRTRVLWNIFVTI